jgi:hypothetical protein
VSCIHTCRICSEGHSIYIHLRNHIQLPGTLSLKIYSLACSSGLSLLKGGPPLLPSPLPSPNMEPLESLSGGGLILHFSRKVSEALFSKQSAMYLPRIGRNLKPLFNELVTRSNRQVSRVNSYCPAPPVAMKSPWIVGWWSIMKSPLGVSVYQHRRRFIHGRSPSFGKN